jgi:putative endonuclease
MAYYVYLLASKKHGTLYLGVTNDIVRRVHEHRTKAVKGFTSRYGVDKLVFEIYDDASPPLRGRRNSRSGGVTGRSARSERKTRTWMIFNPGISN